MTMVCLALAGSGKLHEREMGASFDPSSHTVGKEERLLRVVLQPLHAYHGMYKHSK